MNIYLLILVLMVCAILVVCMYVCDLSIHKSVWSSADAVIPCLSVDFIILFVLLLITYCLLTAFCQHSVIGHNVYGMVLCVTYLDVIMFVHVCFLSPFIARIDLHLICGDHFMMFLVLLLSQNDLH